MLRKATSCLLLAGALMPLVTALGLALHVLDSHGHSHDHHLAGHVRVMLHGHEHDRGEPDHDHSLAVQPHHAARFSLASGARGTASHPAQGPAGSDPASDAPDRGRALRGAPEPPVSVQPSSARLCVFLI